MSPINLKTAKKQSDVLAKELTSIVSQAKNIAARTDSGHKELLRVYNKKIDLNLAAIECDQAGISCRKASGGLMIYGWKK